MYPVVIALFCLLTLVSTTTTAAAKEIALRMIVVSQVDEAKAIRKQLRKGASFCGLAKSKSIAPSRKKWGLSGVIDLEDVQTELRSILQKMKPGQISDVTSLGKNYAILKVISPQVPRLLDTTREQMNEGKFRPAIKSARQALKLENDNIRARLFMGVAQSEIKSYEAAIKTLKQAQVYAPEEPQIVMLLGSVYTKAGLETKKRAYGQQAIASFQRAMKLNERFAPAARFAMARVYLSMFKQPKEAIPHLKFAIDETPQVPAIHGALIQAYIETKSYPQAWKQIRYAQGKGFQFPDLLKQLHKIKKASKK